MITVIFGLSATGKTYLADKLQIEGGIIKTGKTKKIKPISKMPVVIHSDNFMVFEFREALYKMMDAFDSAYKAAPHRDYIIEGVQTARLLRKWHELRAERKELNQVYEADRVIWCQSDPAIRNLRHQRRGTTVNPGFDSSLMKIWNDWYSPELEQNVVIHVNNN